jgi:hypothetical protein
MACVSEGRIPCSGSSNLKPWVAERMGNGYATLPSPIEYPIVRSAAWEPRMKSVEQVLDMLRRPPHTREHVSV